ncbi:MAG: hypothetical protein ACRDOH_06495 [Streptosporangiaceae bacterium]
MIIEAEGVAQHERLLAAGEGRHLPGLARGDVELDGRVLPADKALDAEDVAVAVEALCGPAHVHSSGEVRDLRR